MWFLFLFLNCLLANASNNISAIKVFGSSDLSISGTGSYSVHHNTSISIPDNSIKENELVIFDFSGVANDIESINTYSKDLTASSRSNYPNILLISDSITQGIYLINNQYNLMAFTDENKIMSFFLGSGQLMLIGDLLLASSAKSFNEFYYEQQLPSLLATNTTGNGIRKRKDIAIKYQQSSASSKQFSNRGLAHQQKLSSLFVSLATQETDTLASYISYRFAGDKLNPEQDHMGSISHTLIASGLYKSDEYHIYITGGIGANKNTIKLPYLDHLNFNGKHTLWGFKLGKQIFLARNFIVTPNFGLFNQNIIMGSIKNTACNFYLPNRHTTKVSAGMIMGFSLFDRISISASAEYLNRVGDEKFKIFVDNGISSSNLPGYDLGMQEIKLLSTLKTNLLYKNLHLSFDFHHDIRKNMQNNSGLAMQLMLNS